MRLLIVCHEYPPLRGGAGVGVRHLAECLVALGHPTEVVTAGPGERIALEAGVRVHRLSWRSRPGQLGNLSLWLSFLARGPALVRRVAAELRPNVVLSFFPTVAGVAVARAGVEAPHVTTFVGADIHDPTRRVSADRNPLARTMVAAALRHADAVTAISSEMVHRVESVFPGRRVDRTWLGIPPLDRSRRTCADETGSGKGLVVASVCRLVRRKRLDVLLEALAVVDDPEVRAVVIGDGPLRGRLQRRAGELGITHRVRFTGWVDDDRKAGELAAADVYCQPSEHEAFGLAVVEAMSVGCAVIASEVGGQTDIVRDGCEGFLVPVGDAGAVAVRLRDLARDPDLLRRMGRAAAERAREFTPARTAESYLELFERWISP